MYPFFLLVCLNMQVVFLDVPPKSSSLSSCLKWQFGILNSHQSILGDVIDAI